MDTPFGPDGLPAVYEGGAWRSHDRSFSWDGMNWVPTPKSSRGRPWLIRLGTVVFMVALLGYAIYTSVASNSEFAVGYYIGAVVFFAILLVVYRFAGRWGWFGILIRAGCFLLALLKALTLVAHHPAA